MVNISIDVTDLGGEARPGDKVVLWKPAAAGSATHAGRVISTAPVDVFLTNGKASVPDVEPGDMRVLLQCRGVESQGPIPVTVPDGDHTVTLRSLIESQFEYSPPIVSAVQEAADNAAASERAAIQAQVRSEAAADRAEDRVDDAINNGANLVRNEVKQDADRAVSARQAATQAESNAKASENAAASSASNAKASETNAKQSETNAGDYAAVATTAATEAVDAMERATDLAGGDFATHEYVDDAIVQFEDSFSSQVVKSLPVRRIITSANPDEHLLEGDLLLVTEPPGRLYRRLDSMDGVTQRWNVDNWDIATDSLDGDSVSLHTGGRQARRLVSVDAVSGLADVEAVIRVKASSFVPLSGSSPSLVLRGSGVAGSETGYSASVGRDSIRMGKFVNGTYTTLDAITETIPVGEWFWLRFRALGSTLQVKIWPDGTSEPAKWRRTTSDSSIEAGGWVGPSATTNSSDLYYHSIGVAALTSGDEQAPTEAV